MFRWLFGYREDTVIRVASAYAELELAAHIAEQALMASNMDYREELRPPTEHIQERRRLAATRYIVAKRSLDKLDVSREVKDWLLKSLNKSPDFESRIREHTVIDK